MRDANESGVQILLTIGITGVLLAAGFIFEICCPRWD